MYKDKDRQREAATARQKRRRDKIKAEGVTDSRCDEQGVTDEGMTVLNSTVIGITAKGLAQGMAEPERTPGGFIRVSKPGDSDYVPMCETTKAFIEGRDKRPESGKRGKDIKCFGDLPPDVKQDINKMSLVDGGIDLTILANRTAIAVNYQHQFPNRFHSTGVS